jgi:hypothetical protein
VSPWRDSRIAEQYTQLRDEMVKRYQDELAQMKDGAAEEGLAEGAELPDGGQPTQCLVDVVRRRTE